jgi:hypothetical protein
VPLVDPAGANRCAAGAVCLRDEERPEQRSARGMTRLAGDCVDGMTMALTWLALLLLCAPFEIATAVAKTMRSIRRACRRQLDRN